MLIDYLRERKIKIKDIQRATDIPYTTLNDIANGRVDIMNVRLRYVTDIARFLGITIDGLVQECAPAWKDDTSDIYISDGKYYLDRGEWSDSPIYLCKVNKQNEKWVRHMADFRKSEAKLEKEKEKWKINYFT